MEKEELTVEGQGITAIEDLSHLVNLKHLDLANNRLAHPDSLNGLAHLKFLTKLSLAGNRLSEGVGMHLVRMQRLTVLNLAGNDLTFIPPCIEQLKGLKALILNNNCIRSLAGVTLPLNLNSLVLSHNQIEVIEGNDIRHLKNLKSLSLSHNKLHKFPEGLALNELKQLRLNDNRLTSIPGLPANIEILDLGNNLFTASSLLADLQNLSMLKNVNVRGNPGSECKLTNPRLLIVNNQRIIRKKQHNYKQLKSQRVEKNIKEKDSTHEKKIKKIITKDST